MALHPSVIERLARLAPDQRAAATALPGPSLCIAPAGSGKTTTLVARAAWLIATGTKPEQIQAITFNKRAAVEMAERLDAAILPLGVGPGIVRVRTFHALGREILRDAGVAVEPLVDRQAILASVAPWADGAALLQLDTVISRLKVDLGTPASAVATDRDAGPMARAFVAYEAAVAATGGLDFDDLILRAIDRFEADADFLAGWRGRCSELLVDEVQDVDRAQLRLALMLAAPANRIFLVGDDDQSIYGWRLADVRRILGLETLLPGLRRVDLEVNYRCPRSVVVRAVRLIEHNEERFAKAIRPRPAAEGRLVLAPDASDETTRIERVARGWSIDQTTQAILARTNRELLPAAVVAIRLGRPFRAPRLELLVDDPRLDGLLEDARAIAQTRSGTPLLVVLGQLRQTVRTDHQAHQLATALLGWSIGHQTLDDLLGAIASLRVRLDALRRDDASLTLATAHATKGLEFDEVLIIGMESGRFPSARAVSQAEDPVRAYEEERRLGYVAWTRAKRSLTLLYDPSVPSPFLLEAFSPDELGIAATDR